MKSEENINTNADLYENSKMIQGDDAYLQNNISDYADVKVKNIEEVVGNVPSPIEELKKDSNKGNKEKSKLLAFAVITAVIIFTITIFSYYAHYTIKNWENLVYPGVIINGIERSKMTRDELANKLKQEYLIPVSQKIITIKALDKEYKLNFSDLKPQYNIDEVSQQAFSYKKNETFFNKFFQITNVLSKTDKQDYELKYDFNDAIIIELANKIENEIKKEPVNATLKLENGVASVIDDIKGVTLKKDELISKLNDIASNPHTENMNIEVPIDTQSASITGDLLRKINGVISTFTTNDSSYVRLVNMGIAAKDLNETLVLPGETFSFNDVVGDSLPEKGYLLSHSYVDGKSVEDYGGGVCQVSTTLYGTLMRANIRPIERGPHMMPIWYVPKGLDAAVFYGSMDLKFKNEFDCPIYIYANLDGEYLTISFYGDTNVMKGLKYNPYSVEVSSWAPGAPNYINDPTKPIGWTKVDQAPTYGYKVDVFMQTIDTSGDVIKDEYLYTDIYNANPGYVVRGTKK